MSLTKVRTSQSLATLTKGTMLLPSDCWTKLDKNWKVRKAEEILATRSLSGVKMTGQVSAVTEDFQRTVNAFHFL